MQVGGKSVGVWLSFIRGGVRLPMVGLGPLRCSCSGLEINDGPLCETAKQVRHQSSQWRLDTTRPPLVF